MNDPFNAFCTHVTMKLIGAPDGLLAGLIFAVKDNFQVAGYPTGAGSPDWLGTHGPADSTATAVQMLIEAGATLIGKTQMDELAFSLAGQNFHYGTPINPRARDRIPGGSSSGSAAATAGGLVDFALGTDTAGSVRVPANNCGIYGFRPTHGLIPLDGVVPFSPSFDTVGFFSRGAILLRQVGQVLLPSSRPSSVQGRLLVADDAFAVADEEVREVLRPLVPMVAQVVGLEEHFQLSSHGLDSWVEQFNILRGAEVRATLGEWIEKVQPCFGPGIRERFGQTFGITPDAVSRAQEARCQMQRHLDDLLGSTNIICLPTAPLIPPFRNSSEDIMARYRTQTLKLTGIATMGGLPQVTLPIGTWKECPVGMSLIAGRGQDARLWDLAVEIERNLKPIVGS